MGQTKINAIMDGAGIRTITRDGEIVYEHIAVYDSFTSCGYNLAIHSGKKGESKDSWNFEDWEDYEKAIKEIAPLSRWKLV